MLSLKATFREIEDAHRRLRRLRWPVADGSRVPGLLSAPPPDGAVQVFCPAPAITASSIPHMLGACEAASGGATVSWVLKRAA